MAPVGTLVRVTLLSLLVTLLLAAPALAAITPTREANAVAGAFTEQLSLVTFTGATFTEIPPEPGATVECDNDFDDDADGFTDFTPPVGETPDPGCDSASDNREEDDAPPECSNGFDDDGDGFTDFTPPSGDPDSGCDSAADNLEVNGEPNPPPACSNGEDDDLDGAVDFPADPGCASASDLDEGSEGLPPGEDTNPTAVSDSPLTGFPTGGTTYAILSTGNTEFADDPNDSSGTGQSNGGGSGTPSHGDNVFDLVTLSVNLNVPMDRNCLRVDFRFLSEEFPEFVGGTVNDAFIAELDNSTFQTQPDGSVAAPDNFAFDSAGNLVSINTAAFSETEAAGTTYDGATPRLRASTPITPGAHSIYLSIFDQGDSILDSAAFIDAMRLENAPGDACQEGASSDVTPPALSLATPANGSTTSDTTPTYSGAAGNAPGDSNTVTVKVYSGSDTSGPLAQTLTTTRSGASWSATGSSALTPGTYTVQAEQSDGTGNIGLSDPLMFMVVAEGGGGTGGGGGGTGGGGGGTGGGSGGTGGGAGQLPAPVQGKTFNVQLVSGQVTYQCPGQPKRSLADATQLPIGCRIDARRGKVRITSAAGGGKTQSAVFYAGVFKVLQKPGAKPITELRLVGELENCPRGRRASVSGRPLASAAAPKLRGRRLWGDGKGAFRTRGRRSAATVTGTKWLVEDRCDTSTLTKVTQGKVQVRDFVRRRTVTLRKGQSYIAQPPGRRRR
jgi:Big-like domain-containing protein